MAMNKIKALCDKYDLSHRQLGILMGYHQDTIQKVNVGKRNMTAHFATVLENIELALKSGDAKIPR